MDNTPKENTDSKKISLKELRPNRTTVLCRPNISKQFLTRVEHEKKCILSQTKIIHLIQNKQITNPFENYEKPLIITPSPVSGEWLVELAQDFSYIFGKNQVRIIDNQKIEISTPAPRVIETLNKLVTDIEPEKIYIWIKQAFIDQLIHINLKEKILNFDRETPNLLFYFAYLGIHLNFIPEYDFYYCFIKPPLQEILKKSQIIRNLQVPEKDDEIKIIRKSIDTQFAINQALAEIPSSEHKDLFIIARSNREAITTDENALFVGIPLKYEKIVKAFRQIIPAGLISTKKIYFPYDSKLTQALPDNANNIIQECEKNQEILRQKREQELLIKTKIIFARIITKVFLKTDLCDADKQNYQKSIEILKEQPDYLYLEKSFQKLNKTFELINNLISTRTNQMAQLFELQLPKTTSFQALNQFSLLVQTIANHISKTISLKETQQFIVNTDQLSLSLSGLTIKIESYLSIIKKITYKLQQEFQIPIQYSHISTPFIQFNSSLNQYTDNIYLTIAHRLVDVTMTELQSYIFQAANKYFASTREPDSISFNFIEKTINKISPPIVSLEDTIAKIKVLNTSFLLNKIKHAQHIIAKWRILCNELNEVSSISTKQPEYIHFAYYFLRKWETLLLEIIIQKNESDLLETSQANLTIIFKTNNLDITISPPTEYQPDDSIDRHAPFSSYLDLPTFLKTLPQLNDKIAELLEYNKLIYEFIKVKVPYKIDNEYLSLKQNLHIAILKWQIAIIELEAASHINKQDQLFRNIDDDINIESKPNIELSYLSELINKYQIIITRFNQLNSCVIDNFQFRTPATPFLKTLKHRYRLLSNILDISKIILNKRDSSKEFNLYDFCIYFHEFDNDFTALKENFFNNCELILIPSPSANSIRVFLNNLKDFINNSIRLINHYLETYKELSNSKNTKKFENWVAELQGLKESIEKKFDIKTQIDIFRKGNYDKDYSTEEISLEEINEIIENDCNIKTKLEKKEVNSKEIDKIEEVNKEAENPTNKDILKCEDYNHILFSANYHNLLSIIKIDDPTASDIKYLINHFYHKLKMRY